MGADIIIPLILIAIVVPATLWWARARLKEGPGGSADAAPPPTSRLTSTALREFASPPWRVVYEVAENKLGGIGHVLIGTPGIFAIQTDMDPLPPHPTGEPDARAIGRSAVARGMLDDALRRCGLASDRLITVHWGRNDSDRHSVDLGPGATAVDGHRLLAWAATLDSSVLTPAQVDLAWQTVLTSIGRPDPLA